MHNELTETDIKKMQEELDYRRLTLGPQLVEEVKVMSADKLLIRFRNGVVVEQALGALEAAA